MNSLFQTLSALLLALCLAASGCGAIAEEGEPNQRETDLQNRFGLEADITLDAEGKPVLVNGYPFRTARASYL